MFSCAKILFLVSLLFVAIPTHFLNFKFSIILVCLLFIAYLHSTYVYSLHNHIIYINLSLLSRHLIRYRCQLNDVLQTLVNTNANMVKQLYCSEIHSKNIEIYLLKLYIGKYSEVNDVISTRKNIASVNSINGGRITNYITCASGFFMT